METLESGNECMGMDRQRQAKETALGHRAEGCVRRAGRWGSLGLRLVKGAINYRISQDVERVLDGGQGQG